MAKIGKKRSNPNSVEAYACYCICSCSCGCNCSVVCPSGGITRTELLNQVWDRAAYSVWSSPDDTIGNSNTNNQYYLT